MEDHEHKTLIKQYRVHKAHNYLCDRFSWYHSWHHHKHHKKIHFGSLVLVVAICAGLIYNSFPHGAKAAESFRANYDNATLNADYAIGSSTASNDGTPANITSPGYNSSTGAVTVSSGQTLKYETQDNFDKSKGEIEMKFQLPYDLNGDNSKGRFSFNRSTSGNGNSTPHYDSNSGYVYLTDGLNNRIIKTKMDGTGWQTLGSYGSGIGQFNRPAGIFYDNTNDLLYIADYNNNRIVKTKIDGSVWEVISVTSPKAIKINISTGIFYIISGNGTIVRRNWDGSVSSNITNGFNVIVDLDYDPASGYGYILDSYGIKVYRGTLDTTPVTWTSWGTSYQYMTAISYDPSNNLVYYNGNERLVKLDLNTGTNSLNHIYLNPSGSYFDTASGFLYLIDETNRRIIKRTYETHDSSYGSLGNTTGRVVSELPQCHYDQSTEFIFCADNNNRRIVRFKADGSGWQTIGTLGNGAYQFSNPRDVTYDPLTDYVYVSDSGNGRVAKFKMDGTGWVTRSIGSSTGGITLHNNNLYVTQIVNHYICTVNLDLTTSSCVGSNGDGVGQFKHPQKIVFDNDGYGYIIESSGHRVTKTHFLHPTDWTTDWTKYGSNGTGVGQFSWPNAITYDQTTGFIYIADTNNARVVKLEHNYTDGWINWKSYGSNGSGVGQFGSKATCVSMVSGSTLYVSDQGNSRVVKISYDSGSDTWTWHSSYNTDPTKNLFKINGTNPMSLTVSPWDGRFTFQLSEGASSYRLQSPTQIMAADEWHTIKITYNNTSGVISMLIDGAQVATVTNSAWAEPTGYGTNFYIGSDSDASYPYRALGAPIDSVILTSIASDTVDPTNPSLSEAKDSDGGVINLTTDNWYKYPTPHFHWSGATDDDSGVKDYFVYWGTNASADPQTDGAVQATTTYTASGLVDGSTYYLRVKTRDNAYNVTDSASTLFTYKYEATVPTTPASGSVSPAVYTKTNSFTFTWSASTDPGATDIPPTGSGILSYEYKINDGSWVETTPEETTARSVSLVDIAPITDGQNVFHLRAKDNALNVSEQYTINFFYNSAAPIAPTDLTADPPTSAPSPAGENSFRFSWNAPTHVTTIAGYHYSINVEPTALNSTATAATATVTDHFASQTGENIFYVVAEDIAGNINYANFAHVHFFCDSSAPGIPTNIRAIDASNRETSEFASTIKWSEPAVKGDNFDAYEIFRSGNGGVDYVSAGTATTPIFSEIGLTSQEYKYYVIAKDTLGQTSALSDIATITPTGKYTEPPSLTTNPTAIAGATSVKVSWDTDRVAEAIVECGKTTDYGINGLDLDPSIHHEITISGLNPGTDYHYRVQSLDPGELRDYGSDAGKSADFQFSTQPAPGMSDVTFSDITTNSAILSFKTTKAASSIIEYGTDLNYGTTITDDSNGSTTVHTIRFASLRDGTVYQVKITIQDSDGNVVSSIGHSFTTVAMPTIAIVQLQPVADAPTTTYDVVWKTNVATSSNVSFTSAKGIKSASKADLETDHTLRVSDLADQATYTITVSGRDQYGNEATYTATSVTTPIDTRPPKITNLTIEVKSSGFGSTQKAQVVVSWETDEPASSQIEYAQGITGTDYSNKSKEDAALSNTHVVILSELEPSKIYHLRAVSRDNADNAGYSEDTTTITGKMQNSILDIIINSLETSLGWLFNIFK